MQLNHLDLQVPDVQATAAFFVDHFDFERASNAKSPAIAILSDGAGFTLVFQRRADDDPPYPAGFHVGFYVELATVHAIHARLASAGISVGEIATNTRGTMFYVRAPGDLLIEVNCRSAG